MQDERALTILWRGKYLILIAVTVAVLLAFFALSISSKVYQATAIFQVNSAGIVRGADVNPLDVQEASKGLAQTYATLMDDRSVLEQIRPKVAGGKLSVSELQSRVSTSAVTDTALVKLNVEGPSPKNAQTLAGEIANAFIDLIATNANDRSSQLQDELQARISAITSDIDKLAKNSSNAAVSEQLVSLRGARAQLLAQLANLVAAGLQEGISIRLTAPPTAPGTPVRPRPVLNIAAGLLVGLFVGVGLAWLRARLDRGLRSSDEASELINAPVLATIPIRKNFSFDDQVIRESYDVLRANLAFVSIDQPLEVITFTSYGPQEGKTSAVEGLGYACRRADIDVLIIDGDVRTRMLSTRLGRSRAPGLTNLILGDMEPTEVIREFIPGLSFLPAGPSPPNPASLFASNRMRELIRQLRGRHALVVIDAPPVAHLADASILAGLSDAVVMVARVGVSRREDLPAAAANLAHSRVQILGGVVFEPRAIDETYYVGAREEPAELRPRRTARS